MVKKDGDAEGEGDGDEDRWRGDTTRSADPGRDRDSWLVAIISSKDKERFIVVWVRKGGIAAGPLAAGGRWQPLSIAARLSRRRRRIDASDSVIPAPAVPHEVEDTAVAAARDGDKQAGPCLSGEDVGDGSGDVCIDISDLMNCPRSADRRSINQ